MNGDGGRATGGSETRAPGPTKRARAKSAALWGLVGGFSFLVLAQGFRIAAGDLPVGYGGVIGLAAAVAVASGGIAYATEHRLRTKHPKRRT
ncbi:hypothetical protein [Halorubrum yunnanense]|uniref:DUF7981 domain-containing protein n=1 Tax=Halorubrum yunnanense TaxID=1526162 RepID=A0ABD5YF78_9EURY|nr:hypothetical protein [Halorubrum yunnanense]